MRNCTSIGRMAEQGITTFRVWLFSKEEDLPFPFNFSDVNGISINKVLRI